MALDLWIGKGAVPILSEDLGCLAVGGRVGCGHAWLHIVHGADRRAGNRGADDFDGAAMRAIDVVDDLEQGLAVAQPGRVGAEGVAKQREYRRLVEGGETLDAVAIAPRHQVGVLGEPIGDVSHGPAAAVLERLRQIPVIKAKPGFDFGGEQGVDQPVVE